jgi:SAM-dependent methyltransferase
MVSQVKGYVTDVPYVPTVIKYLAPAWLDHVAVISGLKPPVRKEEFAWCDLGCGRGTTAVILAATHPYGRFHGIDAMAEHTDGGRRLAAEGGVTNVIFHTADFARAGQLQLPKFDYIVAHGVYSWVGPQVRNDMRSFIDSRLKPGGLVFLSYYAMPGRAADLPFQRLVRAVGETCKGDSSQRVEAALKIIDALLRLEVPALAASPLLSTLKRDEYRAAGSYLAHEYMGQHWDPLFVTEVRRDMTTIGLKPVGSATLVENYDSFVLGKAGQEALTAITDQDVREMARDFLIDQFFRLDVFSRGSDRLDDNEQRLLLLAGAFTLTCPGSQVEYAFNTAAGQLAFDNPAARAIVAALASGPCTLGEMAQQRNLSVKDAIANAIVLCASNQVRPVEAARIPVATINTALSRRLGGSEEIPYLALPCGTAIGINDQIRLLLRGQTNDDEECGAWRDFLAAQGVVTD